MEIGRKRTRDNEIKYNNQQYIQIKKPQGYSIVLNTWQPCYTPKENKNNNLPLNFNYWIKYHYISNNEVFEFILSIINQYNKHNTYENQENNEFFINNQLFHKIHHHQNQNQINNQNKRNKNRVILISIHGLSPLDLDDYISNSLLPELSSFSSVPIRHTIPLTLQQQTQFSNNLSLPDNIWRYSETTTASSLIFWPVIPAISYEEVESQRNNLFFLFQNYRLSFKVYFRFILLFYYCFTFLFLFIFLF